MKLLLFIGMLSFVNTFLYSQLKRNVLYTLVPNEVVYIDEYFARIGADGQTKFAVITEDTVQNSYKFILNGKTVLKSENWIQVERFDLDKVNNYALQGYKSGKSFLQIDGKTIDNRDNLYFDYGEPDVYYYSLLGEQYVNYKGYSHNVEGLSWNYKIFKDDMLYGKESKIDKENKKMEFFLNKKLILSYSRKNSEYGLARYPQLSLDENGYKIVYRENDNIYLNNNGNKIKLLEYDARNPTDFKFTRDDVYFMFTSKIYKNNRVFQEVDDVDGATYYWDVNSKGDVLLVISKLSADDSYSYDVYKNKQKVTIKNELNSYLSNFELDENGNIHYVIHDQRTNTPYGIKKSGSVTKTIYWDSFWHHVYDEVLSTDGRHQFQSKWNYDYVVIDGSPYGNSPAINAWYDKEKNSFFWNSFEKNELVFYEYHL